MRMSEAHQLCLVVVDNYEPCPCHMVLVTRLMNSPQGKRVWVCFNIKNPCPAGFGDNMEWETENGNIYVIRNEKLRFKLQMDKMPIEHIVMLYEQLPYSLMYDEVSILFPTTG